MKLKFFPRIKKEPAGVTTKTESRSSNWLPKAAWAVAVMMLVVLAIVIFQTFTGNSILSLLKDFNSSPGAQSISSLPNLAETQSYQSISRRANLDTNLPQGYRRIMVDYTVDLGDSNFGISKKYSIKPESILWANYAELNDDPQLISVGAKLIIPPVDGILYEWQDGDTLDNVAARYKAKFLPYR